MAANSGSTRRPTGAARGMSRASILASSIASISGQPSRASSASRA
jgi:hypothetical protein